MKAQVNTLDYDHDNSTLLNAGGTVEFKGFNLTFSYDRHSASILISGQDKSRLKRSYNSANAFEKCLKDIRQVCDDAIKWAIVAAIQKRIMDNA